MDAFQSIEPSIAVWNESFQIRAFEADASGHLGILHLFNYFQEVAGNHASALGVSIEKLNAQQLTWMLSRFHIQVKRYPVWGEKILLKTWPSDHSGLHALREFVMYDAEGEQIGQGTSGWLMIDLKRRRPIRMPDFITSIELPDLSRPVDDPFNKLPSPEGSEPGKSFTVGYHDLDINQHANSVHYIRWALEAVPDEIRTDRQLSALEVQFRAEAKYGDGIVSRFEKEGLVLIHGLYEQTSNRALAVVRSTWT
ncbi:MAG: hypothetical protein KTR29_00585 [Rhodothermaceae bacterium]|nr:hypothetical protein [Rhodothermaceae bacterium]